MFNLETKYRFLSDPKLQPLPRVLGTATATYLTLNHFLFLSDPKLQPLPRVLGTVFPFWVTINGEEIRVTYL